MPSYRALTKESSDGVQYGKVPTQVIIRGHIAGLDRSALSVYLVLAACVNGKSWSSCVPVSVVAGALGCHKRTVERACRRLEGRGLVEVVNMSGGRGRANTYRLATDPSTLDEGESEDKTPANQTVNPGSQRTKPRQIRR